MGDQNNRNNFFDGAPDSSREAMSRPSLLVLCGGGSAGAFKCVQESHSPQTQQTPWRKPDTGDGL